MARLVCIHGISQEYGSAETLLAEWLPALLGGVSLAGGTLDPCDVEMAFYGTLFRPSGKGASIPNYAAGDIEEGIEVELLRVLANVADTGNDSVAAPKGALRSRSVSTMVQTLARTPFFGDAALRVVIWHLKQVRRYLTDPACRVQAQQVLIAAIAADTRVVVAHSLGSVIAYEVLCANPTLPVRTLITLGSPLGVGPVGRRLTPPVTDCGGQWPGGLSRWFNVCDRADIVAVRKELRTVFGTAVVDALVHNGATAHDVKPYLTAIETGNAIRAGLIAT